MFATWVGLIVMIISAIIQIAMAPRPEQPKAPTIDDVDLPIPDEGTPQIVVFGDVWIEGWTVLTYGNFSTDPIRSSGGK